MPAEPAPSEPNETVLHPSSWLIAPTLALLAGQAVAAGPWTLPATAGAGLVAPLAFVVAPRWRLRALLALLSMLSFSLGYLRHRELLYPQFPENHLRAVMDGDSRVLLEGTLRHEPEKLTNRTRWQVRSERIWHPTGAQELTGDILVSVRSVHRDWRYGDRLRFWIRPAIPRDSGNPGGFDYATYLAQRGIYVTGFLESDEEVDLLARQPGALRACIEGLRRAIRIFIDRNFSPGNGALIKALVVGEMGGITKETRTAFTAAGVNHVLSISGLHVAMLGLVVFALIRFGGSLSSYLLLRVNLVKLATLGSFLAVVFYTALAGGMVPTVRSAIMIGVYELAVMLDREEEVFTSLALSALLIALVWPAVIADISFQLSFLAVLFIVWGMRKIHEWFAVKKTDELPQEKSWVRQRSRQVGMHLAVPLLATLGTGPLVAHYFGHLSLAGFVANPLIVPLVGFVVVPLGLMIGFLSVTAPEIGIFLVGVAEKLLSLTSWLVDLFARLPLANFGVPSPNGWEVASLYGIFLGCFALRKRTHLGAVLSVALIAGATSGAYWWGERQGRKELRVTHLNVGQGNAAVVELPGSKVLLIDGGGAATADFDTGETIIAPFLRSRKILKVDYLVVTHARVDHYGGMGAIVNEFAPKEFWSGAAKGRTRRFEDLEEALEKSPILRLELHDREPCRVIDEVRFCVLYPTAAVAGDGPVVIRMEYGKLRHLFSSDIDKRDEATLAGGSSEDWSSAVMTIPRHGSATASSPAFVAKVQPKLAILSAGARSRAEAQREEVVERYRQTGAEVLSTYQDGAIILQTDGKTVSYRGYKSGKNGVIDLAKTEKD
jgi:competence protein ComEC